MIFYDFTSDVDDDDMKSDYGIWKVHLDIEIFVSVVAPSGKYMLLQAFVFTVADALLVSGRWPPNPLIFATERHVLPVPSVY